jgi:hypothetical protein
MKHYLEAALVTIIVMYGLNFIAGTAGAGSTLHYVIKGS